MRCGSCGHDNPDGMKFCGECGQPLAVACPACATANPPGNKFCGACGSPLAAGATTAVAAAPPVSAAPPAGLRAERRMVSILFADLVGFTPFSESRDPEEVRAMLTRYFERSRDIVTRFRGTVDKFIGDAVMAWWGAVEAREDDAERAVRAALELVDMVGELGAEIGVPDLALRAGVLTGEASVGPGGNEQGLVVGDLVNTASRLQSIALGGTVVIGESTANLVASAIELQPLGEQSLKGKEIPVRAFRAVRVVAQRGGRGRTEALEPPFTGRVDELRILKDQLHAAMRERRARLVSVVGDAGIGKSRLAWELAKYVDGVSETVYWHQGRSPAYGDGMAFWSIGEMIRGRAGIVTEGDDRARSRMKLRTAVAEYVPTEEERRWVEPRLAALLGIEEVPAGDRNELFAAIRTFFQRIAERSPVVMVFEDLHWADDGVLEFIEDLSERSHRHPILVITLARPELLERRPGWGSGRRNTLSMHLAPLSDTDMVDLVTGMAPGIPADTATAIAARSGGVPLYAVEFVRMLLASGDLVRQGDAFVATRATADLAIPDSLSAVIGARLDRLAAPARALVQDAAVLGQSFTLQGLSAVRDVEPSSLLPELDDLVRQEMFELEEDPRSAERGQYRFVQGLIREVAYGRLSLTDRHVRHRRVAEYFAGLGEAELAGLVASHFLAAHQTAPPGTENLLERGRRALLDAGRRAAALQASAQALTLFRQALELTPAPEERGTILIDAAAAAMWAGSMDESLELGRQAVAILDPTGDAEATLRAHSAVAATLNGFYRADEAVAYLEPVFSRLEAFDTEPRVAVGLEMARAFMLNLQPDRAVSVAEMVLPLAERLAPAGHVINGIITKATALGGLSRVLEAEAMLRGAVTLADAHGLQAEAMRATNNLAVVQQAVDPLAALHTTEDLHHRALTFASAAWVDRSRLDYADILVSLGRYDTALEMLDSLDPTHLPPPMQGSLRASRLVIEAHRRPTPDAGDRLRREIDSWGPIGDPQMVDLAIQMRATAHSLDGDWAGTFEVGSEQQHPYSLVWALAFAIRCRDADRVRRALERLEANLPAQGRLSVAVITVGRGALAALGGDEAGVAAMSTGLDLLAKVIPPLELTFWRTSFAAMVGTDHPAGAAAAEAAAEWIHSVGAEGLARIWRDGLPVSAADRLAG